MRHGGGACISTGISRSSPGMSTSGTWYGVHQERREYGVRSRYRARQLKEVGTERHSLLP